VNCEDIIHEYLTANGYEGLAQTEDWDGCGCGLDDLMCCDGPCDRCQPAYRVTWENCVVRYTEEADQCPNGLSEAECFGCYSLTKPDSQPIP